MSVVDRVLLAAWVFSMFLANVAGADCPSVIWQTTYGGTGYEHAEAVEQTSDGGFVFTGPTTSYGEPNGDVYIVKTDDKGGVIWSRMYGGGDQDFSTQIRQLPGGGYVVGANTLSYGAGGSDTWLLRLDEAGDTVWTRTYGGGDEDYLDDVRLLPDGFLLVGSTYNYGAMLADVLVIRTDENGDSVWTRTYGGKDYQFGTAICVTADEDYVIAGSWFSYITGHTDVYIAKITESGDLLWEQTYGGAYEDYAADICETHDGGLMIVGTTNADGPPWSDIYVIKTDATGDSVWTATFGSTGWDGGASICRTFDDYYVVAGHYQGVSTDVFMAKLDIDGNVICTYVGDEPDNEEAISIFETNNAGFILAGRKNTGGDSQALLLRTSGAFPLVKGVSDIPSDQGEQVRLSWYQSWFDAESTSYTITSYSIWRRIGLALLASGSPGVDETRDAGRLGYPPGGWDYVTTVPARGEFEYNCVVPTLCDSTSGGQCMSYFFVSAETASPLVYFDSPVDSGYSVDNLAPSPPEGLHMESAADLVWEEAPEEDFDYFTVYGSDDGDFGEAALIGYTIGVAIDISGDVYTYYHVTATDFAGNEGGPATTLNTYADVPGGAVPVVFALRQNHPNPLTSATSISYDIPRDGLVTLEVIDVEGRIVRTLLDEVMPAGRHSAAWNGSDAGGAQVGPGVYFVRMKAADFSATRKMMLIR